MKYQMKTRHDETKLFLNPCPFCGGEPVANHIGNDYTRKRTIKIKCKKCRAERTDGTLRHDFDWLEGVAADNWNQVPQKG